MKKLLFSAFFLFGLSLSFVSPSFADQINPSTPNEEGNNAIDIRALDKLLDEVETLLEKIKKDDKTLSANIKKINPILSVDIPTKIKILRDSLGNSRSGIGREINFFKTKNRETYTALQKFEKGEQYLGKDIDIDGMIEILTTQQFALIRIVRDLTVFEPPPVEDGSILAGPTDKSIQEDSSKGLYYISRNLIPGIANWITVALMGVSIIMLIGAGLLYIFSNGDEAKEKAKDIIIWVFVGVVLAILSYTIVQLVVGFNLTPL